jgi:hypothetical protein
VNLIGTAGTPNTGGGGGGGFGTFATGRPGGSGIVIIKYPDTYVPIRTIGAGLTYTYDVTGGYRIYTFTAGSDTVTF